MLGRIRFMRARIVTALVVVTAGVCAISAPPASAGIGGICGGRVETGGKWNTATVASFHNCSKSTVRKRVVRFKKGFWPLKDKYTTLACKSITYLGTASWSFDTYDDGFGHFDRFENC